MGYYFIPYSMPVPVEQFMQPAAPGENAEASKLPQANEKPKKPETQVEIEGTDARPPGKRRSSRESSKKLVPGPNETVPPVIELISPSDGHTFLSTRPLDISARVFSPKKKIERVDFFYSRAGADAGNIYNTEAGVQIPNSPLIRIGTANRRPYRMKNVRLSKGVYSIYGMLTEENGVSLISTPKTVIIRDHVPGSNAADKGWYPPSPVLETIPCMQAKVTSTWSSETKNYIVQGNKVRFGVSTNLRSTSVRYKWRVTEGRILGRPDSDSITVDTTGLGGHTIIATVDLETAFGCKRTISGDASIVQSTGSIFDSTSFSLRNPPPDFVPLEHRYINCPDTAEKLSFISSLTDAKPAPGGSGGAGLPGLEPDVLNICPLDKKDPTKNSGRLRLKIGNYTRGVFGGRPASRHFTNGGNIEIEGEDIIWDLTSVKNTPGEYSAVFEVNDRCGTGAITAKTVRITHYCASCLTLSSLTLLDLFLNVPVVFRINLEGGKENDLRYNWLTPGDRTDPENPGDRNSASFTANSFFLMFLTVFDELIRDEEKGKDDPNWEPRPPTSMFDIKVELTGLDKQSGVLSFIADFPSADVVDEMFGEHPSDGDAPPGAEELSRSIIDGVKLYREQFKYEWSLSYPDGREIAAGVDTGGIKIDLKGASLPEKAVLSVRVSRLDGFFFAIRQRKEVGPPPPGTRFDWSVSNGTILSGQGKGFLTVVGLDKTFGTPVKATVRYKGLGKNCEDESSSAGSIGSWFTMGDAGFGGTVPSQVKPPPGKLSRRALKIAAFPTPETHEVETPVVNSDTAAHSGTVAFPTPTVTPAIDNPPPRKSSEHEFVKIAWPAETVYVNQAFSIFVTYSRTAEALQVTDTAGGVVAELKSADLQRLIKDKFGPGREVVAQIRLQSAALYQSDTVTCSPNCQADYLSLASAEQKWTFNVTAHNPGEHKFNLEMWVKPKTDDPAISPERVWSKEDLKIAVRAEMPTRLQIFASTGALGVFGLFFLVRGVNFKVLIAGGDIVGGDKVGGHKVGGDMVGGDKIGGDKITNGESGPDG